AQQLDLARQRGRDGKAAMADDLGGHALADLALGLGTDWQREVGMGLDVDEARRHGKAVRIDDLGCRVIDARPDSCDAAVADGNIAGLAGRSRAVEEKTAADQDVMARAQAVTRPLSSTPLPAGLRLGGKLRPWHRATAGIRAYYTLLRLAPAFEPKSLHARLGGLGPPAGGGDENDRPAPTRRARGCDRARRPSTGSRFFPAPGAKPDCSPARRPPARRSRDRQRRDRSRRARLRWRSPGAKMERRANSRSRALPRRSARSRKRR